VAPLNGPIDPAASKLKVKSNSITLELVKGSSKWWDALNNRGLRLTTTPPTASQQKDSNASLMGMMKELYENGDDSMKKTIAESWQKA
jgi:calcyclin binding protein